MTHYRRVRFRQALGWALTLLLVGAVSAGVFLAGVHAERLSHAQNMQHGCLIPPDFQLPTLPTGR